MMRKAMQSYWRLTRSLTLGVQGVIFDDANRVLLVRHGYRPGWHFPGGGVEKNEPLRTALLRELEEETGVRPSEDPQLIGIFANFAAFPCDHVALFLVRRWQRPTVPKPNAEIVEQNFFSQDELPIETVPAVHRRLVEIRENSPADVNW